METNAWKALSSTAQALYPWIKLEWRGPDANNNGKLRLSVRQAAERLGVRPDTAAEGFRDLQRKGFIVQTEAACLGVEGAAKSPAYEVTELKMPGMDGDGRKLYRQWHPGQDFPVAIAPSNNPTGKNGRKVKSQPENRDGDITKIVTKDAHTVINTVTARHKNRDDQTISRPKSITESVTSLSSHTSKTGRGTARQPALNSGQAQCLRTNAENIAAINELLRATSTSMTLCEGDACDDAT
ncbi:hypothetical protein ABMA32_15910 [Mesorhizobium sp. VNQ89]|uniref:hypothetical protein n=1 Tax=Mesorhizobium quangtriensis TaxID=3157709 RepID=UPI0032B79880